MNEPSTPTPLEILEIGNPILRQKAKPVDDPTLPGLKQLTDNMLATCRAHSGVGISAPQVGRSIRLIIVASQPNKRYPYAPHMDPVVMINPQLTYDSAPNAALTETGLEGCLSIPGIYGLVPRSTDVVVSYFELGTGEHREVELHGFPARIFLHELDHLDGVLFTDRAKPETFISAKELSR